MSGGSQLQGPDSARLAATWVRLVAAVTVLTRAAGETPPKTRVERERRKRRAGQRRRDFLRRLGWSPQHSFGETGLAETVAWYQDNRIWWEPIKNGEYRRYYEQQYGARLG